MEGLEILKVDRNRLEEIPVEIEKFKNLRSFCCDSQRPRLRVLPVNSLIRLRRLQVLSFSNNRIDNINWIPELTALKVLRCDKNRISRLPNQMASLRELLVLDVSHNRLEYIPPCYTELIKRLFKFEHFNLHLRPKHIRQSKTQLVAHLELENFLLQSPVRRAGRDISLAIVGESHAGKSCLIEALKADRAVCKPDGKEPRSAVHQFEMHSNEGSALVNAIMVGFDTLDNFTRALNLDLVIVVIDLVSFELQNGSHHLFTRHVNRMCMWLCAMYEVAPDTPILIVGTHAELVKAISYQDIWKALSEQSLEQGRAAHVKHFADSRHSYCFLCNHKERVDKCRKPYLSGKTKSVAGMPGCVDLSLPHCDPLMNGHLPTGDSPCGPSRVRFPHIIGYYEVDCKKNLPKESKKNNISIENLRSAIIRLTLRPPEEGVPPNWLTFSRYLSDLSAKDKCPFISYEDAVSVAKSMDIPQHQIPFLLHYFHKRGRFVYFDGDETLSKLLVINPAWFLQRIHHVLEACVSSRATTLEMLELLTDKDIEKSTRKDRVLPPVAAEWMLCALARLDICVPLVQDKELTLYLMPNLLEIGQPCADVWPDLPEWDEKQITCDYTVRKVKPCLFTDLILWLNTEGRSVLEVVTEPSPVFLSHHMVFFTSIDVGGCEDCCQTRRRLRGVQEEDDLQDDVLHKVHIQIHPRMDVLRIAVRGASPCCTMKSVLNFVELFLDDSPDDETDCMSSDKTSISSHALSSACATSAASQSQSQSHSAGSSDMASLTSSLNSDEGDDHQFFLLCPKCVLLRHSNPERISYTSMSPKRKAICNKWHTLGSWSRAVTGDYRLNDHHVIPTAINSALTSLPDYEHPKLVMILPPSSGVSVKDWYTFSRIRFLEGFEVHFLCEYTGYWHLTDDSGFRLNQSPEFIRKVGNQMASIVQLAIPMVQVVNGVPDHGLNGRLLAPVVSELVKTYDYLKHVDNHIGDPYTWLTKNKDRVVTMLTKVLANVSDGFHDLYFRVGNAINADTVFQLPSSCNRYHLAKFLRIECSSGRFGPLRPLYVGREVRWLCDAHYEELRTMPSN